MSASNEVLIEKINEVMSELQQAEKTVVEVAKRLHEHNEDPNAHSNLISNTDTEIIVAKLADQVLRLMDRVLYLEKREIKHTEEIEILKKAISSGGYIPLEVNDIEDLSLYEYINTPITYS